MFQKGDKVRIIAGESSDSQILDGKTVKVHKAKAMWFMVKGFDGGVYYNEAILIEKAKPNNDPIVKDVIKQFKKRSKAGIKKYGTTLKDNNTDDFLQHLKEELMDAVLYIQKLQSKSLDN